MKTSVEQINPTRVKLTINVEPAELKPYVDAAYRTIAEQIQVPGFRRGKVPTPIIDQRVGRAAVLDQAISDGLDVFFNQAVAESDVQPLGRPKADVIETPNVADFAGDLVVEVEVDSRPSIELPRTTASRSRSRQQPSTRLTSTPSSKSSASASARS